jgi:hypothetical protein
MTDVKLELESKEKALAAAQTALEAIKGRIAEARQQVEELSAKIKGANPDGDELVELDDRRRVAHTRVEVLEEREARAAVAAAEAAMRAAKVVVQRDELRERDQALKGESDAILDAVEAFTTSLVARLEAHNEDIAAANRLETELRRADGSHERAGAATGTRTSGIAHVGGDPGAALVGLHQALVMRGLHRERAAIDAASAEARRAREDGENRKLFEQAERERVQAENRRRRAGTWVDPHGGPRGDVAVVVNEQLIEQRGAALRGEGR